MWEVLKQTIEHKLKKTKLNTSAILALGFLSVILLGTIILILPISSRSGQFTNILTAGFTAVSATCVTGLIVVDTAVYWSIFGQIVILCLIQIGGLGFMTIAVQLSILIKRSITPKERMLVAMSYNLSSFDKTTELMKRIIYGTVIFEFIGAVILSTRFIPDFGIKQGIYKSVFHSVSAFCNAGFDIMGTVNSPYVSMSNYATDPVVNVTIMILIIMGGIGFLVWSDMQNLIKKKSRISVYSKLVLSITSILIVSGALFIIFLEWNGSAFAEFNSPQKIMAGFFQSVTCRTAGFATVDNSLFSQSTQVICIFLMFIGGASGSTAGGVKVVTMGILVYTIISVLRGKKETIIFRRKISNDNFVRATTLILIQLVVIFIGSFSIASLMNEDFVSTMFEGVSAISTVGLSLGITPLLDSASKIILMFMMYFGRVGILTVAYSLMLKQSESSALISYPNANLLIG